MSDNTDPQFKQTMIEVTTNLAVVMERVTALTDILNRESKHLDEIMKLHQETHSREHDLTAGSIEKSENTVNVKIGEIEKRVEQLRVDGQNYVTREYLERWVQQLDKVDSRVASIERIDQTKEKNNGEWIKLGYFAASIVITVVLTIIFNMVGFS
jgi:hypothetical protein